MFAVKGLSVLVQVLGIAAIVMTAIWMGHYQGGFAWQENPSVEFNYHPVFMITGMIFLQADAILAYRVFAGSKKSVVKIIHACLHAAALIFASVALKAVFDSNNLNNPPFTNLYSLHSWLGIFVVCCFGLQWVLGFSAFLFPKFGASIRSRYLSIHVFWGVGLLVLATATALLGIFEKASFSFPNADKKTYDQLPPEAYLINFLGLLLVVFTALVVFIVTKPDYKRPNVIDDEHLPLAG